MKQIQSRNKSRRVPALAAVLVLAAGLVFGVFLWSDRNRDQPESTNDSSVASDEERESQETKEAEQKKDYIENTPKDEVPGSPVQPSASDDSIQITAHQRDGSVVVTTRLHNFPDGTCSLKVTNGATIRSYSAQILYQPEYSICTGFSIPVKDLGTGGWALDLTAQTEAGISISKKIELRVS